MMVVIRPVLQGAKQPSDSDSSTHCGVEGTGWPQKKRNLEKSEQSEKKLRKRTHSGGFAVASLWW